MSYCKMYDKREYADCYKCRIENLFPELLCCLDECGQHEFCRGCKTSTSFSKKGIKKAGLSNNELNGKTVTLTYVENEGLGILSGTDQSGHTYVLRVDTLP